MIVPLKKKIHLDVGGILVFLHDQLVIKDLTRSINFFAVFLAQ
jgi:hypothetical protein